jgi:hypothetical protein
MPLPAFTRNALAGPEPGSELGGDWGGNLLRKFPYAATPGGSGQPFQDDIFRRPPNELAARDLGFDRMGTHEQPWVTDPWNKPGFGRE